MALIQLKDYISKARQEDEDVIRAQTALDVLAQKVFVPVLSDEEVVEMFVHNPGIDGLRGAIMPYLDEKKVGRYTGCEGDSSFEEMLKSKLVDGHYGAICVTGALGCGKTLLLKYLLSTQVIDEGHCDNEVCGQNRMVVILDFLEIALTPETREPALVRGELENLISRHMEVAALKRAGLSRNDEVSQFWDEQLEEIARASRYSQAFMFVAERLADEDDSSDVEVRKRIRRELMDHPSLRLEYAALLWNHLSDQRFCRNPRCQALMFDNVDEAPPLVQSVLLNLLHSLGRRLRGKVIAFLRPETLSLHQNNSLVLDFNSHKGASPLQVIVDRLARFVTAENSFRQYAPGLSDEEYRAVVEYAKSLLRTFLNDSSDRMGPFISAVTGRSVRTALVLAQNLVSSAAGTQFFSHSPHGVLHQLVTGGEKYFSLAENSPVDNLFRITDNDARGKVLAKLRVVQILHNSPNGKCHVADLLRQMRPFGYDDLEIAAALNDLLCRYRQSIRSNGALQYSGESIAVSGQQLLTLTQIGKGYCETTSRMVEYIEHVMFDCYVDVSVISFHSIDDSLAERYRVLADFLEYLLKKDNEETALAVSRLEIEELRSLLLGGMITRQIIEACSDTATRTLERVQEAVARDRRRPAASYNYAIAAFDRVCAESEKANRHFLFGPRSLK